MSTPSLPRLSVSLGVPRSLCLLIPFVAIAFIVFTVFGPPALADEGVDVARSDTADPSGPAAVRLGDGMSSFIAALDAEQRRRALYDFEDEERFDLRLAPMGLEGLKISDMSAEQWRALEAMLAQVLSPSGLEKMNTIRSLEKEVAETEGGLFGFLTKRIRDAKRYFLTVYVDDAVGDAHVEDDQESGRGPDFAKPWGARFDGHHLSLNWTEIPGAPLSATPLFLGGQPRVVPDGLERAGLRVMAQEESLAVDLLNGLSPEFRGRARIPWKEGSAIRRPMSIAGAVPIELPSAAGIKRSELGPDLRAQFDALVNVHLDNYVPAIAARYRPRLQGDAGPVHLLFASAATEAEPLTSGRALYYRIQGGGLLIEFDNTAEAANHIHVVIRDAQGDFGRDVLAEHWSEDHERP